jgi:hypothetical protein
MDRYAIALFMFGIGFYLTAWRGHDKGRTPSLGTGGELRPVPAALRRLLRQGSGPVLLVPVLVELAGIALVARAVVVGAGLAGTPVGEWSSVTEILAFVAIPIGALALYASNRLRNRSRP